MSSVVFVLRELWDSCLPYLVHLKQVILSKMKKDIRKAETQLNFQAFEYKSQNYYTNNNLKKKKMKTS